MDRKWIIITTLFISLFGGVPGIVSTIEFFKKKPNLKFPDPIINIGKYGSGKTDTTTILIVGSVINYGQTPSYPKSWQLDLYLNDKWVRARNLVIPQELDVTSETKKFDFNKPSDRDVLKLGIIEPSSRNDIALLFTIHQSHSFIVDNLKKWRITYTDMNGEKIIFKKDLDLSLYKTYDPLPGYNPLDHLKISPKDQKASNE